MLFAEPKAIGGKSRFAFGFLNMIFKSDFAEKYA